MKGKARTITVRAFMRLRVPHDREMRIAVLLPGHMRTWPACWRSLVQALGESHKLDFFVHTYMQRYNYHPYVMETLKIDPAVNQVVADDGLAGKCPMYEGVMEEEDPEVPDIDEYPTNLDIHCQLRKLRLCNELRKEWSDRHGVTHDLVVRARMDIMHTGTLLPEIVAEDTVYIPPDTDVGQLTDVCSLGTPDSMDRLIEALNRKYPEKIVNPHRWLYKCVTDAGLGYETVPTSGISVVRRLKVEDGPECQLAVALTPGAVAGYVP